MSALAIVAVLSIDAPVGAREGTSRGSEIEIWSAVSAVGTGASLPELARPVTSIAANPAGEGYWLAAGDGGVFAFGDVGFFGSAGSIELAGDVVSMAAHIDGAGYWLATDAGAVLAFGSAPFVGSVSHLRLDGLVVSIAPTTDGLGYWLLGSDGGVFAFGSAGYHGSGSGRMQRPAVDLVPTATGDGYWLVDADGNIHGFGDAHQLAAPTSRRGSVTGAVRNGAGLVLAWDSGVVDEIGRRRADRSALANLREVVDIDKGGAGFVFAAAGDLIRRLGPSVGVRGSAALDQFGEASQAQMGVAAFYASFANDPHLPIRMLDQIHAEGAIPFITWEPWDPEQSRQVQPRFQLRDIVDGRHDELIWRWATEAAWYNKPFMIRFAHEMNGDWYPWSETVNGNEPGEFVAAWRHVHSIFARAGADNVTWVWNPNVEAPSSIPLADLFPGHDVVDFAAIDGYNAGSALSWGGWRSAESVFSRALDELRGAAPGIPVIIGETSSTESGGNKGQWIRELFAWLESDNPDISMVVWFDESKETTWWVGSSRWASQSFVEAGTEAWCGCRAD